MKNFVAVFGATLGVALGLAPAALAAGPSGTIGFNPPSVIIDRSIDPPMFTIELFVQETVLPDFNAVNVVVGSNDGLELVDFTFDPALMGDLENVENPGPGVYLDDIKFGYFDQDQAGFLEEGVLLGELLVDTTGLPNGDYFLLIDWEIDGGRSFLADLTIPVQDYLKGSALVTIIPEPASLTLLALGLAAAGVRRRSEPRP